MNLCNVDMQSDVTTARCMSHSGDRTFLSDMFLVEHLKFKVKQLFIGMIQYILFKLQNSLVDESRGLQCNLFKYY